MQRSVNNLAGYTICAKDGELGKVDEFYFDDITWLIRYLVVKTGKWLSERKVLIPHAALGITDWSSQTFHVNLTCEQVRNSPGIETEETISHQHEVELFSHYFLPAYWGKGFYAGPIGMVPFAPIVEKETEKENVSSTGKHHRDSHLRSTENVKTYYIHAKDGDIGHVEDYIVDDEKWNICFFIVDTRHWLPGRKVILQPYWINNIDCDESRVYVKLSKKSIKDSPVFDQTEQIGKDYERELYNHYKDEEIQDYKNGNI
jgi:hypothetical protein